MVFRQVFSDVTSNKSERLKALLSHHYLAFNRLASMLESKKHQNTYSLWYKDTQYKVNITKEPAVNIRT